MSSPGGTAGVWAGLGAALTSAVALAQPQAWSDTGTPKLPPGPQSCHRLLSVLLLQKSGSMQDLSDPISGFLSLSIYTFSPFLAPAADLLQGLLPVQVLRRGQSHLFILRSRLRLQQRALGAGSGVEEQEEGAALPLSQRFGTHWESSPSIWDWILSRVTGQ